MSIHSFIDYWIKDPFWGGIDYLTHYGLRLLPVPWVSTIGNYLAHIAIFTRFREVNCHVIKTMSILLPDRKLPEIEFMVRNMWGHVGSSLAEFSIIDRINDDCISIINENNLINARSENRPIIFIFIHTGNWELVPIFLYKYGFNINLVHENLSNRFQMQIAQIARNRIGYNQISPDYAGTKKIYDILENKGIILFAIDEYKNRNVVSPKFDNTIPQNTNIEYAVRLAQRFNAILLPIYCLRKHHVNFEMVIAEPVNVKSFNNKIEKKTKMIEIIHNQCKSWILENIDQWYMLHRLYFN